MLNSSLVVGLCLELLKLKCRPVCRCLGVEEGVEEEGEEAKMEVGKELGVVKVVKDLVETKEPEEKVRGAREMKTVA